jgi:hypothetical protein
MGETRRKGGRRFSADKIVIAERLSVKLAAQSELRRYGNGAVKAENGKE